MPQTVLVTRPIEDAIETAALIQQKKYNVICEPLLKVIFHENSVEALEQYEGLVFTSRHGVRAFCHNVSGRSMPVWTVGDATKDLALQLGFKDVQSAAGNLDDLQAILPQKRLLYVRGEHISRDLSVDHIDEKIIYHTEKQEEISSELLKAIEEHELSHVLFFSVRTAQAFAEIVIKNSLQEGVEHTKALCLGDSMLKSLSVLPWCSIEVASQPNAASLLALLD